MTRTFIHTNEFLKQWKLLGLDDEDLRRLELQILDDPGACPVIKGTGGLRKLRFAVGHRGKRGSVRVCYVDYVVFDTVYLITAYAKNRKDDLSQAEKALIKKTLQQLENELRRNNHE